MFEFWKIRYLLGKVTPEQLKILVPSKLTQNEFEAILEIKNK